MELEGRAAQMARSLAGALRSQGADEAEEAALARAFGVAMAPRSERLEDDHHPAYLHPGRSPLVLLHDVGSVDVSVLVVATLHESVDDHVRLPDVEMERAAGPSAAEAVASLPRPGDERLVERLLGLGPGLSLAVLAEWLDHLRHLHLREDLVDRWAESHEEVVEAWLPFARRIHPRLAVRYAHWARTFARRI